MNQLSYLYHAFSQALDQKKEVKLVFCDISKAFDKVWHKGLLYKLNKAGIKGKLFRWFGSYLSERSQRVLMKGQHSSWGHIEAGVPQGSVLGPLLFLIYINDLTDIVNCNIKLFADDTTLYLVFDDDVEATQCMNNNLDNVKQWSNTWFVNFNPRKTEAMVITGKSDKSYLPLIFDNTPLRNVNEHKHLGVVFNEKLTWSSHIDSLLKNVGRLKDSMLYLKNRIDRSTLDHIYKVFIRPKLKYASIVWSDCTEREKLLLK